MLPWISTRKFWPPWWNKKTWAEVPSWMNDDLYEAEQIPKPGGCILKLKVAWMGWRGWMGMEGSFLPENLRKSNSWWNGGMHEWKGNEMTATEPTNPFSGAKCWFQGGVHGFFCCWFDVWRMDGRDINCMYFFVVKLTELQHLNQHVHLFAKKSTGLRIFALGSQASSVFSKFLWTQLGHLGCWFELPGQDSINIMWLACTFLVEGYDYFFFGGGSYWHQWWMCTKHAYWLPRRQKNWTRNQGTYQMFSGSFDGTTSTGSCFLPNKNRLLQWEKFEFMISRDQKHHEGWVDTQISIISPLSSPRRGFFWITKGESFIKAKLPLNPWNTQVTLGKQLGLPLWPSQSECC